MASDLIEDQSGDPTIIGTRISVDDVLIYLLEPQMTEEEIAFNYSLSCQQVAAARAYILANPDTVLARRLRIEEKSNAAVNPPEVVERAERTREVMLEFKGWLGEQRAIAASQEAGSNGIPSRIPTFREWLAERDSQQAGVR